MKIQDIGILISINDFSDKGWVLSIFSRENGVISGFLRKSNNKLLLSTIQTGNAISFTWMARLDDQLGLLYVTPDVVYANLFMKDRTKLGILLSLCDIIKALLPEREENMDIFDSTQVLLRDPSLENYLLFEAKLLSQLGIARDLTNIKLTCVFLLDIIKRNSKPGSKLYFRELLCNFY